MNQPSERLLLNAAAGLSLIALGCYTAVLRLCKNKAIEDQPEMIQQRQRIAYAAHLLDWSVNVLVGLMARKLLVSDQIGGRHHPRWMRIYFVITGPLPTLGMLVAMITAHQRGTTQRREEWRLRIHRIAGYVGYVSWWLSVLPIFVRPLLPKPTQTVTDVPRVE